LPSRSISYAREDTFPPPRPTIWESEIGASGGGSRRSSAVRDRTTAGIHADFTAREAVVIPGERYREIEAREALLLGSIGLAMLVGVGAIVARRRPG
jgi:hypothetical protein